MAREPFLINPIRRFRRNAMELDPYSGEIEDVPISYEHGKMRKKYMKKKHKIRKIGSATKMLRSLKKRKKLSLSKFVAKPVRKVIRSVRHLGKSGSKHVVRAINKSGHWFTSPKARMVTRNLMLNPFGESLMLVGSNPKRRKGGKSMKRRMKHNPIAIVKQVTDMAQPIGLGILAMAAPERVANFIDSTGGYMNVGARLGVIVGGKYVVQAVAGPKNADVWLLFGLAKFAKDLADRYLLNPLLSMLPTATSDVKGIMAPVFPGSRTLNAPVRPLVRRMSGNLYNPNA